MTNDISMGEVVRRLESVERRFADVVHLAVYQTDIRNVKEDIAEIKESQKWMQRLLVGNFVTLVVALILFLLERSTG